MDYSPAQAGENEDDEIVTGERPEMDDVCREWEQTRLGFGDYTELQARNWNARHCQWPGGSDDQRKHAFQVNGVKSEPFPWDNASDLRVPVIDENINFAVALDMLALKGAHIRAQPVGMDSLGKATMATDFIRWQMSQMPEIRDEAELTSQNRHGGGLGFLKVYWCRKIKRVLKQAKLDDLAKVMPPLAQAISLPDMDDAMEGNIVALLQQMFVDSEVPITKKRAKRMLAELRDTGETTIPTVDKSEDRVAYAARTPGEDIFFPPNTQDLQTASAVYERVLLTPTASRMRVVTDGWDEEYTEYAASSCATYDPGLSDTQTKYNTARMSYGGSGAGVNDGLVEWIYAYQRRSDENGIPGIYLTIFCPAAHKNKNSKDDGYAWSDLLEYNDGEYPFVPFKRERLSRCLLDSRGMAETGHAWQQAIKAEVDARRDAASLATCPPRTVPAGRPATAFGPGAEIEVRRGDIYGYVTGPTFPNNSVEVHQTLNNLVRAYFGRQTSELDASESQTKLQKQVDDFLYPWREVFRKTWSLFKQYGKDEEFIRVLNVPSEQALKFVKADFSEKYDFFPDFDVLSQDPEQFSKKLEIAAPFIGQWDTQGQVDREQMLILALSQVFGSVAAQRLVLPKDTAANKEINETDSDVSKMWSGVDIDPPQNSAAEIRLQRLQQWQQGSQDNPAHDVQQRLAQDPTFKKRIEKYVQKLQFQIDQKKNAQIGREGGAPAYS